MRIWPGLAYAALLAPASAMGATVSATTTYDPGYKGGSSYTTAVVFQAAGGEVNDVHATLLDDRVVISDAGAPLNAGAGCSSDGSSVTCPIAHDEPDDRMLSLDLGDGDDRLVVDCAVADALRCPRVNVTGSDGADAVSAGPEADVVDGGPGADTLALGAGDDEADELPGSGAADTVDGGPGTDSVSYARSPVPVRVDLEAGTGGAGDRLDALTGVENATGSQGSDVLLGDDARNGLFGSPTPELHSGGDVIDGRGGDDYLVGTYAADRMSGGNGDDTVYGFVGTDVLDGGAGDDLLVSADKRDPARLSCGTGRDLFEAEVALVTGCEALRTVDWGDLRIRRLTRRVALSLDPGTAEELDSGCVLYLRVGKHGRIGRQRIGVRHQPPSVFGVRRGAPAPIWIAERCAPHERIRFARAFVVVA